MAPAAMRSVAGRAVDHRRRWPAARSRSGPVDPDSNRWRPGLRLPGPARNPLLRRADAPGRRLPAWDRALVQGRLAGGVPVPRTGWCRRVPPAARTRSSGEAHRRSPRPWLRSRTGEPTGSRPAPVCRIPQAAAPQPDRTAHRSPVRRQLPAAQHERRAVQRPARPAGPQRCDQSRHAGAAVRSTGVRDPDLSGDHPGHPRLSPLLSVHTAPPAPTAAGRLRTWHAPGNSFASRARSGSGSTWSAATTWIRPPSQHALHRPRPAGPRLPRAHHARAGRDDHGSDVGSLTDLQRRELIPEYPDPSSYVPSFFGCAGANSTTRCGDSSPTRRGSDSPPPVRARRRGGGDRRRRGTCGLRRGRSEAFGQRDRRRADPREHGGGRRADPSGDRDGRRRACAGPPGRGHDQLTTLRSHAAGGIRRTRDGGLDADQAPVRALEPPPVSTGARTARTAADRR